LTVRHLPLPAGRDNGARRRREARNSLLTAVLRRPPAVVARTAAASWRTDHRAVADVLPLLPWALRGRRRLPPDVESALVTLSS
jgi:N-acetylglucosaminyl-diphospho-decaprenol L-rhamnosyltransferase